MSNIKKKFKINYKGMVQSEFNEDFAMYRNLCKNVRSFLKAPTQEKAGSIYNRLLLCSRFFHQDFLYEFLITEMDDEIQNNFMIFMIANYFDVSYNSYMSDECIDAEYLIFFNINN